MWKEAVVILLRVICPVFLDTFDQTSKNLRTVRSFADLRASFSLCYTFKSHHIWNFPSLFLYDPIIAEASDSKPLRLHLGCCPR